MRNQEDFMNKKWKVAVVGAGNFSGAYFDNIEQCADAKCVAVCDQDRQRREAAQRRYNLPEAYASVSELLEKCDFDIAIDAASIPRTTRSTWRSSMRASTSSLRSRRPSPSRR